MSDPTPVHILVVDDEVDLEPLVLQQFRRQVRNNEYHFTFAHNGLDALEKLIRDPEIHIILSDINMPEMDGLTLLLKLKEMANPLLRTVIVSAYGDMENIRTAMNRGAFDFVTKPINFDDLEITVKKTIDEIRVMQKAMKEHDQLVSIQHDLNVAREIQQAILPSVYPPYPGRHDFDISGTMTAAKEVGGDFFDFFLIDHDHLGFVIGDVSGKGVPAAIFMAVTRTLVRATGLKGLPAADCIHYVNNLLCKESVACMFVTVFYGIIDLKTGGMSYVNAGHNPPYIVAGDGTLTKVEMTGGTILGCFEEFSYREEHCVLKPGDTLFTYTDGVTEAFNRNDEIYTEGRLEASLKRHAGEDITNMVLSVVTDVNEFVAGADQSDDLTILGIKFLGQ